MEYENGNLILSDDEREILAMTTMNKIDAQYQATYFIGSLTSIKAEAEGNMRLIQSKPDHGERDSLKISLLKQQIEVCDEFIHKGHEAAEVSGSLIKFE